MHRLWKLLYGASTALMLGACGGDEYETLPIDKYEDVDVNVYFYFPSGSEEFLGTTHGASACGAIAHDFAHTKHLQGNQDWGYVCCTIRKGSACYEKIR